MAPSVFESIISKWTYGKILLNPVKAKAEIIDLFRSDMSMSQEIVARQKLDEIAEILDSKLGSVLFQFV